MADYFLVHDRELFEGLIRPALAAGWKQRSFAPCLGLASALQPAALEYASRYHVQPEEILLLQLERGLPFDRAFWRTLVGECLLFAAREIPEFPTNLDSIAGLLAHRGGDEDRTAAWQVLHGSRPLTFGASIYRPEHAGYSNAGDVVRLADYLGAVDREAWTVDMIDLPDLEDREDELGFAREWFAVLRDLYQRAAVAGQVLVIERIF